MTNQFELIRYSYKKWATFHDNFDFGQFIYYGQMTLISGYAEGGQPSQLINVAVIDLSCMNHQRKL